MKSYRKILVYLPVAFVLIFMGRISKAGLYKAYFRTISDVEVRNSKDVVQSKVRLWKEFPAGVAVSQNIEVQNGFSGIPAFYNETPTPQLTFLASAFPQTASLPPALHFLASMPVRAP